MTDLSDHFQHLATAERPALVAKARRVLGDGDEAEDVVQETLVRVWNRLHRAPPRHLRGYLYRAVQLNALKRRARRRQALPLWPARLASAPDRSQPSGERPMSKRSRQDLVEYSKLIPALGILAGLALTFLFPVLVLQVLAGHGLGQGAITGMMIIGVSGGVIVTLFSAIFGIATPGRVSRPAEGQPPASQDDGSASHD